MITIYNENTVGGGLTNSIVAAGAVPTNIGFVCPFPNISTRVRPVGEPRLGIVEAPFITSTSSIAHNPTNFQSGDTTIGNVSLTVTHEVKKCHISAPEGNNGLQTTSHIQEALIRDFEKDLWALAMAVFTAGNHGAADVSSTAANFDITDLEALAAACTGNPRTALLASGAMPGCANDLKRENGKWVYPGIDGGVYEATLTIGDADVAIVAGPTALAFMVEKPLGFGPMMGQATITEILLPRLQIPAWTCRWYDKASRSYWLSVENFFGIGLADATAASYAAAP
jgi:hypothetical protein